MCQSSLRHELISLTHSLTHSLHITEKQLRHYMYTTNDSPSAQSFPHYFTPPQRHSTTVLLHQMTSFQVINTTPYTLHLHYTYTTPTLHLQVARYLILNVVTIITPIIMTTITTTITTITTMITTTPKHTPNHIMSNS
jgi:hypothetical protein